MRDVILTDMIDEMMNNQKRVGVLIEILEDLCGVRIISCEHSGQEMHIASGIELLAELYGEELSFKPVSYSDDNIGDVYFIHNDTKIFQIVTEQERFALLGGDGKMNKSQAVALTSDAAQL